MPSYNRGDVFTVYLDADDSLTVTGTAKFTIVPSGGTTQYGNVSGTNQPLGPYGAAVTLTFTCDTAISYTKQSNLGVAKADIYGNLFDSGGNAFSTSKIQNRHKIERMFARLGQSSYRRCIIGYHGMSIVSGVGTNDAITSYTENFRSKSMAAILGKTLSQQYGGTWAPGVDIFISGFQSVTGSASFSTAFGSIGPNGRAVQIAGGSVTYPITNGRAGQVVRIYMLAVPTGNQSDPVTAQYSLSGANTLATTNMTASTGTALAPLSTAHYYEFSFTLTNAGNTTLTILPPASGGSVQPYFVDADYRTDGGVTVHRLAYTGTGITECCAWALDDTDVQPAGNWTTSGTLTQRQQRRATQFDSMVNRIAATNGGANVALDAAICSFDVNDIVKATTYGYSLADQRRQIQNYVTALNAVGVPVLFVCGNMRDPSSVSATDRTQLDIIQMYKDVSDASSDNCGAAFLDLTTSLNGVNAAGKYASQWRDSFFQIASEAPSYLHPTSYGHGRLGNTLASAIISSACMI